MTNFTFSFHKYLSAIFSLWPLFNNGTCHFIQFLLTLWRSKLTILKVSPHFFIMETSLGSNLEKIKYNKPEEYLNFIFLTLNIMRCNILSASSMASSHCQKHSVNYPAEAPASGFRGGGENVRGK